MKKYLLISELCYDRVYSIGEVAEFDETIGKTLLDLGVVQLYVVPEYLASLTENLSTIVDIQPQAKVDESVPNQAAQEVAIAQTQEAIADVEKAKSKGVKS